MEINYLANNRVVQHALATPLTNILLNAELAMDCRSNRVQTNYHQYLKQIILNANYLKELVTVNQDSSSFKQSFKLKSAINEVVSLYQDPDEELQLITRLDLGDKQRLAGNKLLFQEALCCLINNSIQAYPLQANHKIVIISVILEKSVSSQKKLIKIRVVDGGKGMSWWQQKLILFDGFSTKPNHQGIGLSFVKRVITRHFRGKLSINSHHQKGTRIKIVIPLTVDQ